MLIQNHNRWWESADRTILQQRFVTSYIGCLSVNGLCTNSDHITATLRDELHWLPVRQRIMYKLGPYYSNALWRATLAACPSTDYVQTLPPRLQVSAPDGTGLSQWDVHDRLDRECSPATPLGSSRWSGCSSNQDKLRPEKFLCCWSTLLEQSLPRRPWPVSVCKSVLPTPQDWTFLSFLVLDLATPEGCKAELTWVVVISQDSLPAKYGHLENVGSCTCDGCRTSLGRTKF